MNAATTIESSLMHFWTTVSRLDRDQALVFLGEFLSKCVREDYRKKLVNSLNKQKPITRRFFKKAEEVDVQTPIRTIFPHAESDADAILFMGPPEHPLAFILRGRPTRLDHIFVTDDDSIGRISIGNLTRFVFFDGNRETAFACTP
jgi:hypothetical protein